MRPQREKEMPGVGLTDEEPRPPSSTSIVHGEKIATWRSLLSQLKVVPRNVHYSLIVPVHFK